jgi:hypothetical protein
MPPREKKVRSAAKSAPKNETVETLTKLQTLWAEHKDALFALGGNATTDDLACVHNTARATKAPTRSTAP